MANPHVLVDEIDLARLAMFIDSEGCISLNKAGCWKKVKAFNPKVRMANSNELLVNWAVDVFNRLGIKAHITPSKRCDDNPKWKRVYDIMVTGQSKCHELLTVIYPYLIGKRQQADLVLEWIESRWETHRPEGSKFIPYTKRQLTIVAEMSRLNQRGTSQTVDYELADMIRKAAA